MPRGNSQPRIVNTTKLSFKKKKGIFRKTKLRVYYQQCSFSKGTFKVYTLGRGKMRLKRKTEMQEGIVKNATGKNVDKSKQILST